MKRMRYIKPVINTIPMDGVYVMQTISTDVGSGDASSGGRAKEMYFDDSDTYWDEQQTDIEL